MSVSGIYPVHGWDIKGGISPLAVAAKGEAEKLGHQVCSSFTYSFTQAHYVLLTEELLVVKICFKDCEVTCKLSVFNLSCHCS